ncbi:Npt1/Npt2 family nucleotide transporter, partial [Myxococcota bacterium]
ATRPPTESMFLEDFGHERLPGAWLVGTVVMLVVVELFARFVSRIGVLKMFAMAAGLSGVVLLILLSVRASSHVCSSSLSSAMLTGVYLRLATTYALYVFKEVYIILLVEAFWMAANLIFPVRTARWTYGLFCAAGAIGGIVGNAAALVLAGLVGSANGLWIIIPCLLLATVLALVFERNVGVELVADTRKTRKGLGLLGVPRLLLRSPYLVWILLLVATTQVVITLIDYEYNGAVKAAFSNVDTRTQVISTVYVAINLSSLAFQLLTGPVLRFVGVPATLFAVPVMLGATIVSYLAWPVFGVMAMAKVASKSLDYSLFRAAKEILYIPLSFRDKTEGKALVDMLVYRSAKGGTYPLFQGIAAGGVWSVPAVTLAFVGVWVGITRILVARFRRLERE